MMNRLTLAFALAVSACSIAFADEQAELSESEKAIRAAVSAYAEAYQKHDANALSQLWSPEAVYLIRETGEEVVGREAIAAQFKALFEEDPERKLELNSESIRFVSPNVAVESGTAKLLSPKSEPQVLEYSAVYVKRDGQWLLDRVTENDQPTDEPQAHLKALEWLVGKWIDQDDHVRVESDCDWTKNNSFLTRSFTVAAGEDLERSGIQVIGWDPAAKKIRSWTFDSDGGFAEGTWTQKGDRWFIQNKGYLADGTPATMVNVIHALDDKSFTWQTVERTVGGEVLPNIDEVVVVRE